MSQEYAPRSYSNNYNPRRYQDSREYRNSYDDKRDLKNSMYEDKYPHRGPHSRESYSSQPTPNQMSDYNRYGIRRAPSATYFERDGRRPKQYSYEQEEPVPNQRIPSDIMSKRDRSSADYQSEQERIAELIKKEYQINPPIQLNLPKPFDNIALWD